MRTVLLVVSGPSFAAKAGVAVSPTSPPPLSEALFPKYSHLHTKIFYRQQVSRDGASHCAKILSPMYSALNSDLSNPDVIIKLDVSNAFNVLCRRLTLEVLGGKASCDYACGLKEGYNIETVCEELRNMLNTSK